MSVALVTHNRPDSLTRTLRSLRSQDSQPHEIVISDDSSPRCTADVRRLAREFDCCYVPGPRRGLYANRNNAVEACRGTHIRTMDDDHEFPPGHMATCMRAMAEDPTTVWIVGECAPGGEVTSQPWECPPQLHPRGFSVAPPPGQRTWAIADGAAIYPRDIFDRGLRFNDYFRFGASYLEWGSRLHWLGYEIRHLDETFVIHHVAETGRLPDLEYVDAASRLFAGLCHSFIYQPSVANRLLTSAQFAITIAHMRLRGVAASVDGLRAFRQQQRALRAASHSLGAPTQAVG